MELNCFEWGLNKALAFNIGTLLITIEIYKTKKNPGRNSAMATNHSGDQPSVYT